MILKQAPFLKILPALIVGIVLGIFAPHKIVFYGLGIFGLLNLAFLGWRAWRGVESLKSLYVWGISANFMLLSLGYTLAFLHNFRHYDDHIQHLIADNTPVVYKAQVTQPPIVKTNTVRVFLSVQAIQKDSSWQPAQGEILANFALDTHSVRLAYGDELLIKSTINPTARSLNPEGLDLRTYYAVQHIYQQTYVPSEQFKLVDKGNTNWIMSKIYDLRAVLVQIFRQHCPTDNEFAVASALILGVRNDVSSEITNAYADTGAMHVLSVSGLHVGMIAWVLVWLFNRVRSKSPYWLGLRLCAVLLLIWLFAILTGATPPALRSAAMFSFVSAGQLLRRDANVYNSLASSAFFLLLYNPFWILDVGFQLSYLALWGIVYYQPKIYKQIFIQNKFGDWVWNLTAVSIAATISTLPISLYYFHQFSLASFLSGLVVIPISTIILPLGLLLLLLNFIPFLSSLLGVLFYWLVYVLNASVFLMQKIPYAVIEGIWIEYVDMCLLYLSFGLITWAFWRAKPRFLLLGMLPLCLVFWQRNQRFGESLDQAEVCVYHLYKGSAVSFIAGQKAYTLVDSLHNDPNKLAFMQQNYLYKRQIREHQILNFSGDYQKDFLIKNSPLLLFDTLAIAVQNQSYFQSEISFPAQWILLQNNPKLFKTNLLDLYPQTRLCIANGSNSPKMVARYQTWADSNGLVLHPTATLGAYVHKIR